MKKMSLIVVFVLILALSFPQVTYANMAKPRASDVGSAITFEKNDTISVVSEVLDIAVNGSKANIVATYRMKNTTNEYISTQSMFLSPNIEYSGVRVMANDKDISFTPESYEIDYGTEIKTDDWKYILLNNNETRYHDIENMVDTITFDMHFEPHEEYNVVVSYTYQLGGYPDYDGGKRSGNIKQYLTPAALWKDFSSLTINLHLDKEMPNLSSSNLEFKKIGPRTYQYVSDTLPEENLEIEIYNKWRHSFFRILYCISFCFSFLCASPLSLIIFVGGIFMICYLSNKKRK